MFKYFQMVRTENQEETDFTKALRLISGYCASKNITVCIFNLRSSQINSIFLCILLNF